MSDPTDEQILEAHKALMEADVPTENRFVAFPDGQGGYWIGRTYDAFVEDSEDGDASG